MKREQRRFLVIFGLVFLALLACGKKGPPFLPEKNIPLKVQQLSGEWKNGTVFLKGKVTAFQGQNRDRSEIKGCRVYHARYALEKPPCEGCPVDYSGYREINDEVLRGEGFFCELSVNTKKGIYFFEVRLIGRNGAIGPPSNRVKLEIDD